MFHRCPVIIWVPLTYLISQFIYCQKVHSLAREREGRHSPLVNDHIIILLFSIFSVLLRFWTCAHTKLACFSGLWGLDLKHRQPRVTWLCPHCTAFNHCTPGQPCPSLMLPLEKSTQWLRWLFRGILSKSSSFFKYYLEVKEDIFKIMNPSSVTENTSCNDTCFFQFQ